MKVIPFEKPQECACKPLIELLSSTQENMLLTQDSLQVQINLLNDILSHIIQKYQIIPDQRTSLAFENEL